MMMTQKEIIEALKSRGSADLFRRAAGVRDRSCGKDVYLRGIIEFSSHCCRNCLYCGLRRDNRSLTRYRMRPGEILSAVEGIFAQKIRTVILQSGDDPAYSRQLLSWIVTGIKKRFPEMAVTLSVGERPNDDYRAFRDVGVDRYLLKIETTNSGLYERLHPGQSLPRRLEILDFLKRLGYQTGTGSIVGLPGQTPGDLAADILYFGSFRPEMAGIGPFVPQKDTPFGACPAGNGRLTLKAVALARIVSPDTLLPVTTSLATVAGMNVQAAALRAGANVIMVNFTPPVYRKEYRIYDGKVQFDLPAALASIRAAGLHVSFERGDAKMQ